jgi:threonyl-tRNA synthetase
LLGSLERFIGVYIEHLSGIFPFWLSPEQIVLIPVNNEFHLEYAKKVEAKLKYLGFRCRVDERNESLGKKTREIQKSKTPYMAVIGDKEVDDELIALRKYGSRDTDTMPLADAILLFQELNNKEIPEELKEFISL